MDIRAELDRARRGTRISRGQLCQLLGIDQQRHAPAGPVTLADLLELD